MENTIRVSNKHNLKVVFDIKGSSFRRYTKLQQKRESQNNDQEKENQSSDRVKMFWREKLHCKEVLKDMNFVEIERDIGDSLLQLDIPNCDMLLKVAQSDSKFLASIGIMDYSLLLGIETETSKR